MKFRRGDVYYFDFGEYKGSEQGGIRPAVILSNEMANSNGPVLIVAPITSKIKKKIPTHLELSNYRFLKGSINIILMEQIVTKDKIFVKEKLGRLNDIDMYKLNYYINISLQLFETKNGEFSKVIDNKIDELLELRGYINIYYKKYKDITNIKNEIDEYESKLEDFKSFCYIHKLNYKLLYNKTVNIS